MSHEISLEEVRQVARLARIALAPESEDQLRGELTRILHAFESLEQLSCDDVEPTSHALLMGELWREDVVVPGLTNDEALANAPERVAGGFAVPRVIE